MTTKSSDASEDSLANVIPFDVGRAPRRRPTSSESGSTEREVVAVVTVTRFIGEERVHAQVPVFADEIHNDQATRAELKNLIPELSELLADGAVEANSYLDRVAAKRSARSLADFYARR
jgi:hypothetical protein